MLDEFSKTNPYGIKARPEIAGASYPDVYNKVSAAIQAGQPPRGLGGVPEPGRVLPGAGRDHRPESVPPSKKYGLSEEDQKDYFQTFLDSDLNPQFQGERLGFPTQRSIEVMYYNADWLKQLGYNGRKTGRPGKRRPGRAAIRPRTSTAGRSATTPRTSPRRFSRGGRILAPDASAYVFNSEAGVETVAMIQRMFKNKCAVEIPTSERNGEQNRFAAGQILFTFASSSGLPFYQEAIGRAPTSSGTSTRCRTRASRR